MQQAFERADYKDLAALAHWLKGSGGTAGFDAFTAPARALEEYAKLQDRAHIQQVLEQLQELAGRISVEVA